MNKYLVIGLAGTALTASLAAYAIIDLSEPVVTPPPTVVSYMVSTVPNTCVVAINANTTDALNYATIANFNVATFDVTVWQGNGCNGTATTYRIG